MHIVQSVVLGVRLLDAFEQVVDAPHELVPGCRQVYRNERNGMSIAISKCCQRLQALKSAVEIAMKVGRWNLQENYVWPNLL